MKNINIEISDELHKALKVTASKRSLTLKKHITLILTEQAKAHTDDPMLDIELDDDIR